MDQKVDFDVKEKLIEIAAGVYVERDTLRIAEKIQEYDPNLRLKYCAENQRLTDAPFKLVEICPDGIERVIFDIWELDERVLERLYNADTKKFDINNMLDTANLKAKEAQERRYKDIQGEAHEIADSIFKSSKDTYKFTEPYTGKRLKIKAQGRAEVEE